MGSSTRAWGGRDDLVTAWARFCRNRLALLGLALVVVLALSAALAPWLAPLDPARQSLIEKRARPGAKYLLGADEFGRDILSRVIYGSRVALLVGVLSMLIALGGGLLLGTLAGFSGGWIDAVLMRAIEILLAFPYLLLALAIVAMLGPGALNTTIAWESGACRRSRASCEARCWRCARPSTSAPRAHWARRARTCCAATSCPTSSRG